MPKCILKGGKRSVLIIHPLSDSAYEPSVALLIWSFREEDDRPINIHVFSLAAANCARILSIFSFAALASLLIGGTLLERVLPAFEVAIAGGPTGSAGGPAMGI